MSKMFVFISFLAASNAFAATKISGSEASAFLGSSLEKYGSTIFGSEVGHSEQLCRIEISALNEKAVKVSLGTAGNRIEYSAFSQEISASVNSDMSEISMAILNGSLKFATSQNNGKEFMTIEISKSGSESRLCKFELK